MRFHWRKEVQGLVGKKEVRNFIGEIFAVERLDGEMRSLEAYV